MPDVGIELQTANIGLPAQHMFSVVTLYRLNESFTAVDYVNNGRVD